MARKVGNITHFFNKIGVAVIELSDTLKTGETIKIRGATTDFDQPVDSMQIEHETVQEAGAGQSVGLKVKDLVRAGDEVFAVGEEDEKGATEEAE